MQPTYLTVTALSQYIRYKFDKDPYLERVYLTGEISNFKRNRPNSHQYFSLKDEKAKISAVMFQAAFKKLRFTPDEGMKVLVIGRISLYEKTGNYQIYIEHMEPDGIGQLFQAYEETKNKLQKEGLFSLPKKKLPIYPKRIAIITSPSGAVIRDIITTVKRRYPIVQLVIYPTYVQGEKAAKSIAKNVISVAETNSFDTLIIARGGGSFEDLFPFNEEIVARAIAQADIPIISSVGHETDTTLADLAADVRAATPTAAAELAVPILNEEILKIKQLELRAGNAYFNKIERLKERLSAIRRSYIFKQPERLYETYNQNIDQLLEKSVQLIGEKLNRNNQSLAILQLRLNNSSPKQAIEMNRESIKEKNKQLIYIMRNYLKEKNNRTNYTIQSLDHLSPLKIMSRGYSYVTKNQKVVRSIEDVEQGDSLAIHLLNGKVNTQVTKVEKGEKHD